MRQRVVLHNLSIACLLAAAPALSQEEVYLKVTSPGLQRLVIAFAPPTIVPGVEPTASATFVNTLKRDLDMTAVVGLLPEENARLVEIDAKDPSLTRQRWRAVGAQFLLDTVIAGSTSQLAVDVKLTDLASGQTAYSRRFQAGTNLASTVAHTAANEVLRVFTGRPGPFLSRIAFVSDRSGFKEVWVMRWDGSEPQQLTTHRSIAVAPAWSPDGQRLAFTSFLNGPPQLFLLKPTQGQFKTLSAMPGVNSSPSFSPDGTQIAFATGDHGSTDIYVVPTEGGAATRLTTVRGINTQPAWSPNGRQILFTSTMAGNPQLFLMDAEGTNVRRLTFDDRFADEGAWNPDGVRIAYTTFVEDRFQIAILDLRSTTRTVVAGPGSNESPCWSPDGTMLAFVSSRGGKKNIFITDPVGHPRQITSEGNNVQPSWVAQIQ